MSNVGKIRISIDITEDEMRGLLLVVDSFGEHLREGLGTGDDQDDARGRAAARWIGRLRAVFSRERG